MPAGDRIALDPTLPPGDTVASVDGALDATMAPPPATGTLGIRLVPVDRERYEGGRELARGGMGRIRIARDRRLDRDVAIKELLHDSPDARARFEREVRITARLQHPTIVNVLEAGQWPSGDPFYVMKLVVGESLDRVIAKRTTLAGRLGLLPNVVAVVEALAFAHSRRIIHRDLKPSNVLVGEFGETVVIDWGLAKSLDEADPSESGALHEGSAADATVEGAVLGTPSYMAPEQAQGAALDARADVYALGAMLYHVLGGAAPYTGRTTHEILACVLTGPPKPLSERDPTIPADLVAIVDKALAREPADRYPSAAELAADLMRFQTGQLVGSHRYTFGELARRWVRRHRIALAVAAVAVLGIATAAIIGYANTVAAQHRAEGQRAIAQTNQRDAEDLLDFMLVELRAKLAPLGKLELLETVAQKATAYYEHRPEAASDDELDHRAQLMSNVSDIERARGKIDAALVEARTALAVREAIAARAPGGAAQRVVVESRLQVGKILLDRGDSAGALEQARAALVVAGTHATTWPYTAALAHQFAGEVLLRRDDLAGAVAELRTGLALAEPLADLDGQRAVADLHTWIGDAITRQGKSGDAIAEYRTALATAQQLSARDASNKDVRKDVATYHDNLGRALEGRGELAAAVVEFRASLAITELTAGEDPTNAKLRASLATAHSTVGTALRKLGKTADAAGELQTALAMRTELAALDPHNTEWQRALAVSHARTADLLEQQGNLVEALASQHRALAITETLRAQAPRDSTWASDALRTHGAIAALLVKQSDVAGALAEKRAGLAIAEDLVAASPGDAAWQRDLYTTHVGIGDLLADTDRDAAAAEYRLALPIVERMLAKDGDSADLQRIAGVGHLKLGKLLAAGKDYAAALVEDRAARARFEHIVALQPTNRTYVGDLLVCRRAIAEILWLQHDTAAAGEEYRSLLALVAADAARDPDDAWWQRMLAVAHSDMGDVLDEEGRSADALAEYRAALEAFAKLVAKDRSNGVAAADVARLNRIIAACCKHRDR